MALHVALLALLLSAAAPAGLAAEQHLRGQRLPLLDRVEISIIEESQPRWLAFLRTPA